MGIGPDNVGAHGMTMPIFWKHETAVVVDMHDAVRR